MPRRPRLHSVLLAAVWIAACGGRQTTDGFDSTSLVWSSLIDAVPGDVNWVGWTDLRETDSELPIVADGTLEGLEMSELSRFTDLLTDMTGVSLTDGAALTDTGVDPEGEALVFARTDSPILIVGLESPAHFDGLLDEIEARNPDMAWSRRSIGGTIFRSGRRGPMRIEIGIRGPWAIARVSPGEAGASRADAEIEEVFYGYGEVGRFAESDGGSALLARVAEGERLRRFWFSRPRAFGDLWQWVVGSTSIAPPSDEGAEEESGAGLPPELQARCDLEAERIETTYPWVGVVFTEDVSDGSTSHMRALTRMNTAGAERWKEILQGVVEGARDASEDSALYGAVHIDLRALMNGFATPPELAICDGLAGLSGRLAALSLSNERQIDYNLSLFTGNVALGLFDVRMAGFAPFVDAAILLETTNPPFLTSRIEELLEEQGARGTVDPTASVTTIDYRLLHLRFRLLQLDDRVVLVAGSVPEPFVDALTSGTFGDSSDPLGELAWNGERIRGILQTGLDFLEVSELLPPSDVTGLRGVVEALYGVETLDAEARWEGSDLVLSWDMRFDEGVAPRPPSAMSEEGGAGDGELGTETEPEGSGDEAPTAQ